MQPLPRKSPHLQNTHTVSICLSKGLGAPVGTMLAAPQDYISRAVRCCKSIGRGLRHVGILSAAGKLALEDMVNMLETVWHLGISLEDTQLTLQKLQHSHKRLRAQ
eukprot:XP_014034439.1 PREDICTED: low specificity L-threonine aldolase-like [Salmo salar]